MDEKRYFELIRAAFSRIEKAVDQIDPELVDLDGGGDVLTLTCRDKTRIVINTQRPVREIWLAGAARAWHFGWDEAESRWVDKKRNDAELFATLSTLLSEHAGTALPGAA